MKSWVEVSGERLAANVAAVRSVAGEGADVLAVVKADGYGHGAEVVAPALAVAGVRWMGVTDVEEGAWARLSLAGLSLEGLDVRLLVMAGMEVGGEGNGDAEIVVRNGLTPVVWTPEHLRALQAAAESAGSEAAGPEAAGPEAVDAWVNVHIEVDTGMSRQGAAPGEELAAVLEELLACPRLRCEAAMTHFAEAEVAESIVTEAQKRRFEEALAQFQAAGVYPKLLHAANSSAIDEGSTRDWLAGLAGSVGATGSAGTTTLVRPGYAVYGHCLPVEGGTGVLAGRLQPVLTWKTRMIGLREIAAGTTVGYGATFVAPRRMRLALLPVGYADGFRRAASSGIGDGWVMLGGERAPVVGRVSMNLTVVDVTEIAGVAVGDEVVLLGEGVSAEDHARWAGTIGYDVLCGIRAKNLMV